uniref:Smt1 n=1 Tax=Arundo donax TaxID=35708 RepID=A0A0A9D237_ARUDO
MKSALTKSQVPLTPANLLSSFPLDIWYSLLFNPVTEVKLNLAISLNGPPIPQPTSKTFIPGFNPSCRARKCSCRLMLSRKDSPLHL